MNKAILFASLFVLFASLSACAPKITRSPEVTYEAPSPQVFAEVIKTISTAEPLPYSLGWVITQSDSAGGFVAAQTVKTSLLGIPTENHENISVVISPKGKKITAVIVQGTGGTGQLASDLMRALDSRFGAANVLIPN